MSGAVLEVAARSPDPATTGPIRAAAPRPLVTQDASAAPNTKLPEADRTKLPEAGQNAVARATNNDYCEVVALDNNLSDAVLYTRNGSAVDRTVRFQNQTANGHCVRRAEFEGRPDPDPKAPPAIQVTSCPETDDATAAHAEHTNGKVCFGVGGGGGFEGSSENTSMAATEEFASCADESPAHEPAVIIDTHSAAASTAALIDLSGGATSSQCALWHAGIGIGVGAVLPDALDGADGDCAAVGEVTGNGNGIRHPTLARGSSMPAPEHESTAKIAYEVALPFLLAGLGMVAAGVLLDIYTVRTLS